METRRPTTRVGSKVTGGRWGSRVPAVSSRVSGARCRDGRYLGRKLALVLDPGFDYDSIYAGGASW
jgi:hypothetical protein